MNEVLVIIPTYNESENIIKIIESIFTIHPDISVLVVDDNSPDGTSGKVKEVIPKFKGKLDLIIRGSKLGLGTAYLCGFEWAMKKDYDFIISMDADLSHNPSDLYRLYNSCVNEKNDVSIGSRYIDGINVVNWPLQRIILSYFASFYVRLITRMKIMDPTSGFVCYSVKSLKKLNLSAVEFNGYAFQIEMKFKLWKKNFKLKEHQIIFVNRKLGNSKMNNLENSIFMKSTNMLSSSFEFGFEQINLFSNDKLNISLSQPNRAESGEFSFRLLGLSDKNGILPYTDYKVDISPSGRQKDLTISYYKNFSDNFKIGVNTLFTDDIGHISKNGIDKNILLSAVVSF